MNEQMESCFIIFHSIDDSCLARLVMKCYWENALSGYTLITNGWSLLFPTDKKIKTVALP